MGRAKEVIECICLGKFSVDKGEEENHSLKELVSTHDSPGVSHTSSRNLIATSSLGNADVPSPQEPVIFNYSSRQTLVCRPMSLRSAVLQLKQQGLHTLTDNDEVRTEWGRPRGFMTASR
ncbi:hypothetical protein MG293_020779 [Ovis ammon polii]|uniref:Uncharacterized protein n=1 Tax=Ovis ammon polii TaxID=230172 RepID=A0AAD4XX02_OVIAM|nr:hypothetical protein MG293_020779 [Ovis ammon polii]